MQVRFLKRPSGKTPLEQNSSGKKIEAESAVPILVYLYIIIIVHKYRQSVKRIRSNKNILFEVFPLTAILAGSGKTVPFEKRHAGCEEREKINRRRIYDTLRINFFEATKQTACIFSKGEMDEETGLYYYGARYLDPKYSRWLSGDPALSDYIPKAPIDDEAKKHNENLPGMGGVFNVVNLHLYHYAGNNPVKYTDPDGKSAKENQARNMLYKAAAFIINNAETPEELIVAKVVTTMMNNKKVQLDDFLKREPSTVGAYGFYDPRNNTVTNEKRDIIVLDINMTVDNGLAELVDTLSHEATHAAHSQAGHNNNLIAEEIDTWNMGLKFSNKYRSQNNLRIQRTTPYVYEDLKYYEKLYNITYDPNDFKELQ